MDHPLDSKMHTMVSKSARHILLVVQGSAKASTGNTGFTENCSPPHLLFPQPQILSVDHTQKVRVRHLLGTGVKETFSICAGHLNDWAFFILFILLVLCVCLFAQDRGIVLLFKAYARRRRALTEY